MVLARLTRLLLSLRKVFKMPIGTIAQAQEKFDLETLPGAFIVVRRMTFGEKLSRQDEMLSMRASMEDKSFQMNMLNKKTALTDFGNLIVDHNITDADERQLNFKNAKDVLSLDPRVGDEISYFIDRINSFEGSEEIKK